MRSLYIFLFGIISFSPINPLAAQEIPNGGFEEWEIPNTWTETPVGWMTENGQLIQNTVRDSFPNSGDWAMQVHPIPNGIGEYGQAYTNVAISSLPSVLEFHAKWEKTASTAVGVEMVFMFDDAIVFTDSWYATTDTSEWVPISIPVSMVGPMVNHVLVRVFVSIGDFAPGEGWISVDDMQFGIINGVDVSNQPIIKIGPNPVSDHLNIDLREFGSENTIIHIIDNQGKMIYNGNLVERLSVSDFAEGQYVLGIEINGVFYYEKFIVVR